MLNLVRGNEDNLEGRVIVFSRLKEPDASEHKKIFAIYSTTDPAALADKLGIQAREIEKIVSQQKEENSKIFKGINSGMEVSRAYGTILPAQTEIELFAGTEDVLYAGSYHDEPHCMMAVKAGIEFYMNKHFDQMKSAVNLKEVDFGQELPVPEKNYRQIGGEEIASYITTEFISPMIYENDEKTLSRLIREFIGFGRGSDFMPDIYGLCASIKNSKRDINSLLVEAYVKRIEALHNKQYSEAALWKEKILKITGEPAD